MKIGLFASAFYPHVGGVEELVRQLALQQRRRGDQPMVLTVRWPKDLPAAEEYEGVPVRRYVFRVPDWNWKQRGTALLLGPGTLKQVCRDLCVHQADVLHVQCVSSNAHYALQAKRRLGLPLVVSLQGELTMDADRIFERSDFARSLMRAILNEADALTACSAQTLAEAEAYHGKPFGERGSVIYNGIRLEDFADITPYNHPRPYLLGIGRLVSQKGFDVLLRAFARCVERGEAAHDLLLAGDGAQRAELERLAGDLHLSKRVRFLGRVDRPTAAQLFCGCSFFVLPSRHEPMGIVNLEAMAAGKAVVASRVGGVPELVEEGRNGLLVPGDDVDALTPALLRCCDDRELRARLGAAGKERARCFDWSVIAEQYDAVYRRVLSGRRPT